MPGPSVKSFLVVPTNWDRPLRPPTLLQTCVLIAVLGAPFRDRYTFYRTSVVVSLPGCTGDVDLRRSKQMELRRSTAGTKLLGTRRRRNDELLLTHLENYRITRRRNVVIDDMGFTNLVGG